MSLTALSSSFADAYVNAPAGALLSKSIGAAGAAASTGSGAGSTADNLKALTEYIPSEVLTLYIAALAAVDHWTFTAGDKNVYLQWIFWICLAATPVWMFFSIFLQSTRTPPWQAFAWAVLAAPLAFAAYAYAIPGSWLITPAHPNAGLFATLILLVTPLVLHSVTLVYTRLFPPPSARTSLTGDG